MAADDMGNADEVTSRLDYWHSGLPAFASVKAANGVTELRIRSALGRPFKRAVVCGLLAFLGLFIAMVFSAVSLRGAPTPLRWVPILFTGAVMVLFLGGLIVLPVILVASQIVGEVIVAEDKLILRDVGARYELPLSQIRCIRQVIYPGSRLEMDFSGPLNRLFFRGTRTAMEIEVPDGRLEFFRVWEDEKVAWLAGTVNRLLFPSSGELVRASFDERQATSRVVASRTYGKPRRHLLRVGLIVGATATAASGWYTYRGASSSHWPTVQGRVVRSHFEEDHGGDGTSYHADIQYAYEVAGVSHTNDDFGYLHAPSDSVVKDLVTAHPVGSPITVYYNPAQPSKSIVIPGVGPLTWLICGLSVAPLLLALPLALKPTTPQQDALAARYRIAPPTQTRMMDQLSAVVRWSAPPDAWHDTLRAARRSVIVMAMRVIAITAVAVWAAHHWLAPHCPPDFNWHFALLAVFGLVGGTLLLQVVSAQLVRPPPPTYGITETGVLVPSKEKPILRWGEIVSFTVEPDRHSPNARTFTLHLKSARQRAVLLPGGDDDARILSELSSHLPEGAPPVSATPLRTSDWILGVSAMVLAWVIGLLWLPGILTHRADGLKSLIMIIGCFAGPGTWIALLLWRRRAASSLLFFALLINSFSTFGGIAAAMLGSVLRSPGT